MSTRTAGLTASPPHALPFAPSLHVRSFLLPREEGNVLVYGTNGLASAFAGTAVARLYLNHGHEAMFAADPVDAPVFVHEADREAVGDALDVRATFSRRHMLDDDFEVIPIPGHTPGATAYLWDDGERRHLFTGDSIYLSDGEWIAALLDSSDPAAYMESLELIRELEFDVLVPWAATAGDPWYADTDRADTRRRIDAIIARVRKLT
jgi:glyoxylase-like metal-dependent hydrolase (beta-lactamase superfamily II)